MSTIVIEAEPRSPPVNAQERDYISFSAIRTYQACPLQYFFRYVAGLPKETISSSLVFGSAIHRAIEHHFRRLLEGQAAPSPDELLTEYKLGWQDDYPPIRFAKDENAASFDGLAQRMLTAFAISDLARPKGRVLAIEETLRGQIIPGLPDLLGRVDLIVDEPDCLVIADWKTSRARYTPEQAQDSTEQLLLYAELARDFAPGKQVRLDLSVLTKTKEVSIDRHSTVADPLRVSKTKRIVEQVWQAIKAEHFYPAPSTINCGGCPYRDACRKWPA